MKQIKVGRNNLSITNRSEKSIDRYFSEISHLPLMGIDEELECARRIKEYGDDEAKQKLITSNLRFVVSVAKQYQNRGMSLSDLISTGNAGLVKAAGIFDHTRGFKFISYSVWWIRQSILTQLANNKNMIRLPVNKVNELNKIRAARIKMEQIHSREVTDYEVLDFVNEGRENIIDRDVYSVMNQASEKPFMLDAPIYDEPGSYTYIDKLSIKDKYTDPEYEQERKDLKKTIQFFIAKMSESEKIILENYFGLNETREKTISEIAAMMKLTDERVRQVKVKALKKLRHRASKGLRIYL